ncbi:MAG: hypothetical protein SGI92_30505 [Bryobacteraceae bacterium]|nr:hypothetical protein [Bryobacteraceae bacterium]
MEQRSTHEAASDNSGVWTWIFLAGLLVLSVVICVGALALTGRNEQIKAAPQQAAPAAR